MFLMHNPGTGMLLDQGQYDRGAYQDKYTNPKLKELHLYVDFALSEAEDDEDEAVKERAASEEDEQSKKTKTT
jgi:hypothetical protein